jgi:ABC-type phosphate transport system substrate-binding protein
MRAATLLLWLAFATTSAWAQTFPPDATVVANNPGVTSLTEAEVRAYMRAEQGRWQLGEKQAVTVVLHSTSPVTAEECAKTARFIVNSDRPATLQKYWLGLVFEGRAAPPIFVKSEEELIAVVRQTPGAIGLIYGTPAPADLKVEVTP